MHVVLLGNAKKNEAGKKTENLKPAKTCHGHLGGKLGKLLFEQLVNKGWLAKQSLSDKHFYIIEKGKKEFTKLGIDLDQVKDEAP